MRIFLWLALALAAGLAQAQAPGRFSFAIIGDAPYNFLEVPVFVQMLKDIDEEDVAFVVHVGDIKNGASPCSDELLEERKRMFQASRHPFIYVPGDNEWTDCHSKNAGGYDPIERLARLRQVFYPGDASLGQSTLRLERQSDDSSAPPEFRAYRENVRWTLNDIMFIGLNVPGSNNNFGRTPQMNAEYELRSRADAAWLGQGFELAKKNVCIAVFVLIQADLRFDNARQPPPKTTDGYAAFKQELLARTLDFAKPVFLVHGDTHWFRVDQPLIDPSTQKRVENFTRIESFGSPYVDWIKVNIDPSSPTLFSYTTGTKRIRDGSGD